jgi:hypothetical protein
MTMTDSSTEKRPLSSRAKRGICFSSAVFVLFSLTAFCAFSSAQSRRPPVRGIAMVELYSSNIGQANSFYKTVFSAHSGPEKCAWGNVSQGGGPEINLHAFCSDQNLKLVKSNATTPSQLLEVIFATDDLKAMKIFLAEKGVEILKPSSENYFAVHDPEGHQIGFMQSQRASNSSSDGGLRIIHSGFMVRDRAA